MGMPYRQDNPNRNSIGYSTCRTTRDYLPKYQMNGLSVTSISGILWLSVTFSPCLAAQTWQQHEKHEGFELFSETLVDSQEIVRELSDVRRELDGLLQLGHGNQNVEVVIFSSNNSYRNYLSAQLPEAVRRRAVFYKSGQTFQIYTFRHAELAVDLRHEYTHALLHQTLPFVPLWIDEGLAEFMEERPEQRAKSSRQSSMKWRCRTGWKPSLKQLEQIPSASAMTQDHYRDSWAWISFLASESAATRTLLRTYLQAISAGEAPGSFSEWVQSRDPEVINRVGSYFRRIRISLR
jgi:hypothetical protein